jgi:hypothetical protein
MKIKLTYSMVYDIDKLMPEIKASAMDYPVTSATIEEFITDRFISPQLVDTHKDAVLSMEYVTDEVNA